MSIGPSRKEELMADYASKSEHGVVTAIVVAMVLPTGAVEIITNTQFIPEKMAYYNDMYDELLRLKANDNVYMKGWMIA
jgi:3-oxoacyl-ACP reductase-like protein